MTKLAKNEFMEVIREMVSGKVSSVACAVDIDNTMLKIAIHKQPYIDVNMEPFYFGYCLDTLTLSKIADVVVKLASGLKFSDEMFESVVTRHEPKSVSNNMDCNEKSQGDEMSDEEFKSVLLEHVYPKLVSSPKLSIFRNCVSRNVLDMTLLYYMDIENPNYPDKTPFISEKALEGLNITEAELYAAAIDNMLHNWDVFMACNSEQDDAPCFALTNKQDENGASVILVPGLLNKIACELNDNLYIIPFNSNCVMIHPASANNLNLLKMSLSEFPGNDILSRNVIFYDRATDNMSNV